MSNAYPVECPHEVRFEVMRMAWRRLTFVHWPVPTEQVQALLPSGLTADTFDGTAWIALVPFEMEVMTPGGLPIPREGRFAETNVRTYVVGPDGTPGIWFFSLEAARLLATVTARVAYGLPYFWAKMSLDTSGAIWTYGSQRRWPGPKGARSRTEVAVGASISLSEQSELERFLTARWGLYSELRHTLLYAPVWHEPWVLRRGELLRLDDELVATAGVAIGDDAPVVHCTDGVTVRIGRPHRVPR